MAPSIARAEPTSAAARRAMVENQLRTFDVNDLRVLSAFEAVPRELFLPGHIADLAYSDAPLTMACEGATRHLFAPMVLARMFQGLDLSPADNVLIVAAGSGYAAAIAAELCSSVVALEDQSGFHETMEVNFRCLGQTSCRAVLGPLAAGWSAEQPYSAVLVCGAVETNLGAIQHQVAPGGRLVAVQTASHEATRRSGKVVRFDRIGGEFSSRVLFDATGPVLEEFRLEPAFSF